MNGIQIQIITSSLVQIWMIYQNGTASMNWWRLAIVGVQRPRYKAGTSYPVIWVDVPLMAPPSMVRDFVAKGRTPIYVAKTSLGLYQKEVVSMTYETIRLFS